MGLTQLVTGLENRKVILALLPGTMRQVYWACGLSESVIRRHLRGMTTDGIVTIIGLAHTHKGSAGRLAQVYALTGRPLLSRHEIANAQAAQQLVSYFSVTIPGFLGDVNQLEAESHV